MRLTEIRIRVAALGALGARWPDESAAPRKRRQGRSLDLSGLPRLPSGDLRPMAGHADGHRRPGWQAAPEGRPGRFLQVNPLVTLRTNVAFTYGTKWKQRHWEKQGDDYFVLPAGMCEIVPG